MKTTRTAADEFNGRNAPAVEISGFKKNFGATEAVRGLDLSVARGEMFALVGPDGAGKTTTIRTLIGVEKPDEGRLAVLGLDVGTELNAIKRRIGYLSQRFSLYGDLSVDENIEFFAEINGVRDYAKRRDELLEFTRLSPFRTRLAARLSGGMKQKLALACTLIHRPDVLFLDEPTTGVDPVSRREFWMILSDLLQTGMTIVMATPYLDEAERCGRVGLMHKGSFLVTDSPAAIKASLKDAVFELVCPRVREAAEALRGEDGIAEVQLFGDRLDVVAPESEAAERRVRSVLDRHGIPIESLRRIEPSLENVFISLIRGAA
jgi:ABC-2 type transport system ATP-binding protein